MKPPLAADGRRPSAGAFLASARGVAAPSTRDELRPGTEDDRLSLGDVDWVPQNRVLGDVTPQPEFRPQTSAEGLPDGWALPSSCILIGNLYRRRGRIRKRWARALFAVQYSMLFVCLSQQPFLVEESIPLSSLTKVDPVANDPLMFSITWVGVTNKKKGKTAQTTMQVRASNEFERDQWVMTLRDLKEKYRASKPLGDFVAKEDAYRVLRNAYGEIRDTKKNHLGHVLSSIFLSNRQRCLSFGWSRLAVPPGPSKAPIASAMEGVASAASADLTSRSRSRSLRGAPTDVEAMIAERTASLERRLAIAQRRAQQSRSASGDTRSGPTYAADTVSIKWASASSLVHLLACFQRSLLSHAFYRMFRYADSLAEATNDTASTSLMIIAWKNHSEMLARSLIEFRRSRLASLLETLVARRLRDTLDRLHVLAGLGGAESRRRGEVLKDLLTLKNERSRLEKIYVLRVWRASKSLAELQTSALRCVLGARWRRTVVFCLRSWYNVALKASAADCTAIAKIVAVIRKVELKAKGLALRQLRTHCDEQINLDALQVAANFSEANARILQSYVLLPYQQGVILLEGTLKKKSEWLLHSALAALRFEAKRQVFVRRAAGAVGAVLQAVAYQKQVVQPFVKLKDNWRSGQAERAQLRTQALEQHLVKQLRKSDFSRGIILLAAAFSRARHRCLVVGLMVLRRQALKESLRIEHERFVEAQKPLLTRGRFSAYQNLAERIVMWIHNCERHRKWLGFSAFVSLTDLASRKKSIEKIQRIERVAHIVDRVRTVTLTKAWQVFRTALLDLPRKAEVIEAQAMAVISEARNVAEAIASRKISNSLSSVDHALSAGGGLSVAGGSTDPLMDRLRSWNVSVEREDVLSSPMSAAPRQRRLMIRPRPLPPVAPLPRNDRYKAYGKRHEEDIGATIELTLEELGRATFESLEYPSSQPASGPLISPNDSSLRESMLSQIYDNGSVSELLARADDYLRSEAGSVLGDSMKADENGFPFRPRAPQLARISEDGLSQVDSSLLSRPASPGYTAQEPTEPIMFGGRLPDQFDSLNLKDILEDLQALGTDIDVPGVSSAAGASSFDIDWGEIEQVIKDFSSNSSKEQKPRKVGRASRKSGSAPLTLKLPLTRNLDADLARDLGLMKEHLEDPFLSSSSQSAKEFRKIARVTAVEPATAFVEDPRRRRRVPGQWRQTGLTVNLAHL